MSTLNNSQNPSEFHKYGLRELILPEYATLLGCRDDFKARTEAIRIYNDGKPEADQLKPLPGRKLPFRGTEVRLYRDTLPGSAERILRDIEAAQGPFVGQWLQSFRKIA